MMTFFQNLSREEALLLLIVGSAYISFFIAFAFNLGHWLHNAYRQNSVEQYKASLEQPSSQHANENEI